LKTRQLRLEIIRVSAVAEIIDDMFLPLVRLR